MKKNLYLLSVFLLLFCNCSNNRFYGQVYDYDTEKPIKNVIVNIENTTTQTDSMGCFDIELKSNSEYLLLLRIGGYAEKKIYRKPDSLGLYSKRSLRKNKIYLFNTESDFSNKK